MSLLNKIFNKIGYEKFKNVIYTNVNENEDKYLNIFKYFPLWISKFMIQGCEYGGNADYSKIRTSLLNLDELKNIIDFKGKSILELGPLEGGNSILLEKMNIISNLSIEGRVDSYVKCCVVKNIYDLNKTKFILDDVRDISVKKYGKFDIAVVLGLLYHLDKPNEIIQALSLMSDVLILSTHYADEESPYKNAKNMEIKTEKSVYRGRIYNENPKIDPNAGLENISFWPYEKDLINMCKDSGFSNVKILERNPDIDEQYKLIYLVCKK